LEYANTHTTEGLKDYPASRAEFYIDTGSAEHFSKTSGARSYVTCD